MKSWVEVSLNTPAQLSLPLYLPDDETFASFWPGDNSSLLAALQNVLRQEHSGYIYLWAREGAGRSHLLHAACAELSQRGDAVGYGHIFRLATSIAFHSEIFILKKAPFT